MINLNDDFKMYIYNVGAPEDLDVQNIHVLVLTSMGSSFSLATPPDWERSLKEEKGSDGILRLF